MKKLVKQWLAFSLTLGFFASCSQDRSEPNSIVQANGETVTLSLSAEVSVDDDEARAINYKLATKNGKLMPMPQLQDKQVVAVHTIVKSSEGVAVAKTLNWIYNAQTRKLVLKDTQRLDNGITVSRFNNDNGVKWYISGMIGGELVSGSTQVVFNGNRQLKGTPAMEGAVIDHLDAPYAFGWTELTINTKSKRDADGSYAFASIPSNLSVNFRPLGSVIAYKIGNNQKAGSFTFTPNGIWVDSNTFGDMGTFQLSTDIPSTQPENALPTWTEDKCGSSMYYTFAPGHAPAAIAHGGFANRTYYTWVMPNTTQVTTPRVRVVFKGKSSRPQTETFKDYTNTYTTDYTLKESGTQGKVTQGKVHTLTANAISLVRLPIEYVTEYNLAGGPSNQPNNIRPKPEAVLGPLRFAQSHDNDQSGYYSGHQVCGYIVVSGNFYPYSGIMGQTLDTGEKIADHYVVPSVDQWWGIFTANPSGNNVIGNLGYYTNQHRFNGEIEPMTVGDNFRGSYESDYSPTYYTVDNATSDAVFYAIRFKANPNCQGIDRVNDYDVTNQRKISNYFPRAVDNSLKCAYRYTRVGGADAWRSNNAPTTPKHRVIVDVVYLGDDRTSIDDISNPAWWTARTTQTITRIFPVPGQIGDASAMRVALGEWGSYKSRTIESLNSTYIMDLKASWARGAYERNHANAGGPLRLFKKLD